MENRYLVGAVGGRASGHGVAILRPPRPGEHLSVDDALLLAAYLVALADPSAKKFRDVLDKVLES